MLDFPSNSRSFNSEDDARAFILATECDPSPDNLARVGTGWVVVDATPNPGAWKGHKLAKDDTAAAANSALDGVADLKSELRDIATTLAKRIAGIESELAATRAQVSGATDLTDTIADIVKRLDALESPETPSGGED